MTGLDAALREELTGWPGATGAAAVLTTSGLLGAGRADGGKSDGARDLEERAYRWASVTKPLTALVTLDLVARGELDLDEPAGPPGATVAHLLAHASGLSTDSDRVLAAPGLRRIYSNRGFEVLGELLEHRTGSPYARLLADRVTGPLEMARTTCPGSPAHGAVGPVADLARLAAELLAPRRLSASLVRKAGTTAFPGLSGVLPGFGRQEPNDWGLGCEVRGTKEPHWTSPHSSPATFGHFGQAGALLWVDPVAGLACVAASDTAFGAWAAHAWPRLATRVLSEAGRGRARPP